MLSLEGQDGLRMALGQGDVEAKWRRWGDWCGPRATANDGGGGASQLEIIRCLCLDRRNIDGGELCGLKREMVFVGTDRSMRILRKSLYWELVSITTIFLQFDRSFLVVQSSSSLSTFTQLDFHPKKELTGYIELETKEYAEENGEQNKEVLLDKQIEISTIITNIDRLQGRCLWSIHACSFLKLLEPEETTENETFSTKIHHL